MLSVEFCMHINWIILSHSSKRNCNIKFKSIFSMRSDFHIDYLSVAKKNWTPKNSKKNVNKFEVIFIQLLINSNWVSSNFTVRSFQVSFFSSKNWLIAFLLTWSLSLHIVHDCCCCFSLHHYLTQTVRNTIGLLASPHANNHLISQK